MEFSIDVPKGRRVEVRVLKATAREDQGVECFFAFGTAPYAVRSAQSDLKKQGALAVFDRCFIDGRLLMKATGEGSLRVSRHREIPTPRDPGSPCAEFHVEVTTGLASGHEIVVTFS